MSRGPGTAGINQNRETLGRNPSRFINDVVQSEHMFTSGMIVLGGVSVDSLSTKEMLTEVGEMSTTERPIRDMSIKSTAVGPLFPPLRW